MAECFFYIVPCIVARTYGIDHCRSRVRRFGEIRIAQDRSTASRGTMSDRICNVCLEFLAFPTHINIHISTAAAIVLLKYARNLQVCVNAVFTTPIGVGNLDDVTSEMIFFRDTALQ